MSFICEKISREDREEYNLDKINKKYKYGRMTSNQWVIDRESKSFLMKVASGRENLSDQSWWVFMFEGCVNYFGLMLCGSPDITQGKFDAVWQVFEEFADERLGRDARERLYQHLKLALLEYGGAGIYSSKENYRIDLQMKKEA